MEVMWDLQFADPKFFYDLRIFDWRAQLFVRTYNSAKSAKYVQYSLSKYTLAETK